MKVQFRIALRYLFARKSRAAVNVISLVSVAGIALATAALVVVMSVFNGFNSLIESRLSVLDPPLSAIPTQGKEFSSVDSLCNLLETLPEIDVARPVIEERALAVFGEHQMVVRLRGIPEAFYSQFAEICPVGFPWEDYHPRAQPAVVSVGVANRLELPVASEDVLLLYEPKRMGRINPASPMSAFRIDSVAPSAVYVVNQQEVDADLVFAPFALVAKLLQYKNQATDIYIYPTGSVDAARSAAQNILGSHARVMTLNERQSATFQVVNIEKWVTFMLLGFILLIASFNVISSLSLLIIEKEPNADTLHSLGMSRSRIRSVYRIEGLLITAFGTIIGIVFGSLLSLGQQYFKWVKIAADASNVSVTAYPVEFHLIDLLPVTLLALAVGVITSLIATRKI